MNISQWLSVATLVGVVVVGAACREQKAADEKLNSTTITFDKPIVAGDRALDATREGAATVIDKTKEIAGAVGSKTKEVVSTTGEVITDGWITTKISAKFVDESLLKGSDIDVDTDDHVVTLKGTVASDAARSRAATIARGTEGVTRVVNQLVVRAR